MNDKVKHIIAGVVIGLITALLIRLFWIKDLMILGAGFAMIGGAAKELIWDKWFKSGWVETSRSNN